jgi:hypothetical protein
MHSGKSCCTTAVQIKFSPGGTAASHQLYKQIRARWNWVVFVLIQPKLQQELKTIIFLCTRIDRELTHQKSELQGLSHALYNPLEISDDDYDTDEDDAHGVFY